MSILVDWQIRQYCQNGMIAPFEEALVNPASIDVRIGNSIQADDHEEDGRTVDISEHSQENPFWIYPGNFLLAETIEVFNLPDTIAGEFRLKSSRAREKWNHSLAAWIDPGFHDSVLTLELQNLSQFQKLPIYPGLRIGQCIFYSLMYKPERSYRETGRYNGDRSVQASKG